MGHEWKKVYNHKTDFDQERLKKILNFNKINSIYNYETKKALNKNLSKTFVCEAPIAIEAREKVTGKLTPLDRFDFYDTENVYC